MKCIKFILPFLLLTLILTLPLMSAIRGKVRIFVTDSKGNPIPSVKITLVSMKTSVVKHEIYTNKKGIAIHGSLENHVFEFTFEKEGYQPQKKMVKIPAGLLIKEDITLYTQEEAIMQIEAKDPHARAINKYNQAVYLLKEENYNKALALLKESISLDDTIHQAHYETGKIYYRQEKYDEAVKHADEAILLDKEYSPPYRLLAAIYEKLGKMEKSKKYTKLAQEVGGLSGIDKYNEAVKYINNGDVDSAIPLLEETIQLDSRLADAYYQLGLVYINKAKNEKAISNLERYLELQPEGQNAETARSLLEFLKKR